MHSIDKKQSASAGNIIRIAGAFAAWLMGSGFATGQEILQFFTSYGYKSYIMITLVMIGYLIVGPAILEAGSNHKDDPDFNHFEYFCGRKLGWIYSWYLPISLFAGMVILISGSGATLEEYFGLNHYVGALLMASAALIAYVIGFQRFVKVASFIAPVIILFTLFVGLVTLVRDFDNLLTLGSVTSDAQVAASMADKQPAPLWLLSAFLFLSYNMCGGSKYYSALGMTATVREARIGASMGAVTIIMAIFLMNSAMLTNIADCCVLGVPTLYLTRLIAYSIGAVFSIVLIMGIFSTCSAMLWTVTEKLISEGFVRSGSKANYICAAAICVATFLLGLLPFADLIGVVYTLSGYIGIPFIFCVIIRTFSLNRSVS